MGKNNKWLAKVKFYLKNQYGEIAIKQIAVTVAVIVIIGLIINMLKGGLLKQWVEQVWDYLIKLIESITEGY